MTPPAVARFLRNLEQRSSKAASAIEVSTHVRSLNLNCREFRRNAPTAEPQPSPGFVPDTPLPFRSLIPLPEIISEVRGVGPKSKTVQSAWHEFIGRVGNELFILNEAPVEDICSAGAPLVAEAIDRMRHGKVITEAGYDGEHGTVRVFQTDELPGRPNNISAV